MVTTISPVTKPNLMNLNGDMSIDKVKHQGLLYAVACRCGDYRGRNSEAVIDLVKAVFFLTYFCTTYN